MSVAIMQPYFFPYLGYFQLVQSVDDFVFYDDVMFIKKGWINRNQILMQDKAFLFTIPLFKQSQNKTIRESTISWGNEFPNKWLVQLQSAYKKAPHYDAVRSLIDDILQGKPESIADLAISSIVKTMAYLGIEKRYYKSSELGVLDANWDKADRLIEITKFLGSDHYINAKNGQSLYDKSYFENKSCQLQFLNPTLPVYQQGNLKEGQFVAGLSMIDVLMWNNVSECRNLIDSYGLI
ncbi:WbqC family protein [Aquirufa sp. ROCK2-A2]